MSHQATLADLEDQGHRLFSTPHAIKILKALHRGEHLPDIPDDADPQAIDTAVDLLNELGLVDRGSAFATQRAERTVTLTPRGDSLADWFAQTFPGQA